MEFLMFNSASQTVQSQNINTYIEPYPIKELKNKNSASTLHQFLPFQNESTPINIEHSYEIVTSTPPNSPKKRKKEDPETKEVNKKTKIDKDIQIDNLDEIAVLTLEEFTEKLKSDPLISSIEKFSKLLSIFTKTQNTKVKTHNLWIEIPKIDLWMNFIIDERKYDSQCFQESEQNYPAKTKTNQSYYYINACHAESVNDYYFQIRIDKQLKIAEIIHIERAPNFSGNEVKALCISILDYLSPQKIFLNDDAKIPAQLNTEEIALRVSLPIVSDNKKTWYPKFKPMTFQSIKLLNGKLSINQNEHIYQKAVSVIRNTLLSDLIEPNEKESKLVVWMHRYFIPFNPCDYNTYTVHLLGKAIFSAMKVENTKLQATFDFSSFYKNYLVSQHLKKDLEPYKQALDILINHKFWVNES